MMMMRDRQSRSRKGWLWNEFGKRRSSDPAAVAVAIAAAAAILDVEDAVPLEIVRPRLKRRHPKLDER